ncbi:MAG: PfkB family carbohydrate kinase, partial [Acidobacteriota bacterium]|nr:PfkB family carbohydrate kinase [Acidobacteriota bacterium]
GELGVSDVESMREVFRGARIALFQLESPLDAVAAGLKLARQVGLTTILDPAPAQPLPPDLMGQVDILTPNESEALGLLQLPPRRIGIGEAAPIAKALLDLGPRMVILKMGAEGCYSATRESQTHHAGFTVDAVDTTAAGDTFNAGLAVALAEDRDFAEALRFANAAAAISVTRAGAQASVPSRAEVETFLKRSLTRKE